MMGRALLPSLLKKEQDLPTPFHQEQTFHTAKLVNAELSTPTHLGWERIPGSYLRETPYFGSSRRCWGQWSHCCSCTGRLVLCRRKQEQADTSPLMVCTHLGTWLLGRVGKWEPKDNSSRELPLQQGHSERCVCKTLPCPSQCHKVKAKLFILDLSVTNYCYVPMWTFTQYQLQLAHQKKLCLKKPQKNKQTPPITSFPILSIRFSGYMCNINTESQDQTLLGTDFSKYVKTHFSWKTKWGCRFSMKPSMCTDSGERDLWTSDQPKAYVSAPIFLSLTPSRETLHLTSS